MPTQLEIIANQQRVEHLARNEYNYGDLYSSNNTGALSDGDEKGKGESNNLIGSSLDINTRTESVARNKFGKAKNYPDF